MTRLDEIRELAEEWRCDKEWPCDTEKSGVHSPPCELAARILDDLLPVVEAAHKARFRPDPEHEHLDALDKALAPLGGWSSSG